LDGLESPGINGHLCLGDGSIDVDLVDKLLERAYHNHHHHLRLRADGEPAVVDDRKTALPWCASAERALRESRRRDGRGHCYRRTDECVDSCIVSEDAEECLYPATAWFSSAGLKGLESSEPVGGRNDDRGRISDREGRWGREKCDKVVCNEAPVCMRYGELSWTGGSTIDYRGYMDIKGSQAFCPRVEQAVGRQDVNQSKRLVSTNESVFVGECIRNRSHSSIGIGAFLVLKQGHALGGYGRHFYKENSEIES